MGENNIDSTDKKLGEARLGKLMFSMSVHSILALLFYTLYSLTDVLFISVKVNDYAAGAVAATVPLLLVLSAVSTTVGYGGASVISRALGKNDKKLAADIAASCFMVNWFFSILVTVFGLIFLQPLLRFMGISQELMPYAEDYAKIILIFSITATGFSSLIRAEGASLYGLLIWIIPLSVNIALDAILIFGFNLGVLGAAIGTVAGQGISVLMSMYFFFIRKNRAYKIKKENFKINFRLIRNIAATGISSFIQQMFFGLLIIICNRTLNRSGGADAVTAFGFVVKAQTLLLVFQTGIVQAQQPVIGYNYSANNKDRVKKTVYLSLVSTFIAGILVALTGVFLRQPLLKIFTDNTEILNIGKKLLLYISVCFPLKGFYLTLVSVYQQTGYKKNAILLTLISSLCLQFPLLILMGLYLGTAGVGYSFIAFEIVLCLLSICLMVIKKGSFRRIINEKHN